MGIFETMRFSCYSNCEQAREALVLNNKLVRAIKEFYQTACR